MLDKILKFLAYLIGIIIAVPVVVVLYAQWSQRPLHAPTFYVRVSVDMKVNDKPVHMERIITCRTVPKDGRGLEGLFTRVHTSYLPYPMAFGERQPDKSAMMMWTPYECEREEYKDEAGNTRHRARQTALDYVPRIGWTPDYSPIETLEYYIDRQSFSHSNTRIKDIKIHSELLHEEVTKPSEADDFYWFTGWKPSEKYLKTRFIAFYAQKLSENEWRGNYSTVDHELDSYTSPQMVQHRPELERESPPYLIGRIFRDLGNTDTLTPASRGSGVSSSLLYKMYLPRGFGVDLRDRDLNIQLFPKDGALEVTENNSWDRLILKRVPKKHDKKGSPWITPSAHLYRRNDQIIAPIGDKYSSLYLYDPISRDLFMIKRSFFTVYPKIDNPLFEQTD